jgi:uncharacterized protein YjbJ (UPF0337 family)
MLSQQGHCEVQYELLGALQVVLGSPTPLKGAVSMDKDRIKGAAQQAKGAVKEVAGKVSGDAKLESEGKADKVAGKVQNAVGGLKDTLRGK